MQAQVFYTYESVAMLDELQAALYSAMQRPYLLSYGVPQDFFYCLVAVQLQNNIGATCVVYKNDALRKNNKRYACIGNYECIDNSEVAALLFQKTKEVIADLQVDAALGPMNASTWDAHRFTTASYSNTFFAGENVHQPYYEKQWIDNGFVKSETYFSCSTKSIAPYQPARIQAYNAHLKKRGIEIVCINLLQYEAALAELFLFCEKAFCKNVFYTPIAQGHFVNKYAKYKQLLNEKYVLVARCKNELVGFLFAYHNIANPSEKELILKTIAVENTRRTAGLAYTLYNQFVSSAIADGYTCIIHAFMHSANESKAASVHLESQCIREYTLYEIDI